MILYRTILQGYCSAVALLCITALSLMAQESTAPGTVGKAPCCDAHTNRDGAVEKAVDPLNSSLIPISVRSPALSRVTFFDLEDREHTLSDYVGQPLALAFVYTRCINEKKCPTVTRAFVELQREAKKSGLLSKIHLALMTYDPENDTPDVLRDYAKTFHLEINDRTSMLRPSVLEKELAFKALSASVSFGDGEVSLHGIQLLLYDKVGRLSARHQTVMWKHSEVVNQLTILAEERL